MATATPSGSTAATREGKAPGKDQAARAGINWRIFIAVGDKTSF